MEQQSNIAEVEGLLFISGDEGITLTDLAKLTGFMWPAVQTILEQLKAKYEQDDDCALVLLQSGNTYRLATKSGLSAVIKHYFEAPLTVPLTNALLEVLAIVAYKQPITRVEIDAIRGVQSSGSLQKLIVRGLVTTSGRLDAPGRPFQYATTTAFLDYFGLSSLDELPPLTEQLSTDDLDGDIFMRALQRREKHRQKEENQDGTRTAAKGNG